MSLAVSLFAAATRLRLELPDGFPGKEPSYPTPVGDTQPEYFEFIEKHSGVLYPVIGGLVLLLLVVGILKAWRAQDLDGQSKAEFKREIIHELRKHVTGLSGEALAKAIGLDSLKTMRLLEELQTDGVLISHTSTERLTTWRLKGVGAAASQR